MTIGILAWNIASSLTLIFLLTVLAVGAEAGNVCTV